MIDNDIKKNLNDCIQNPADGKEQGVNRSSHKKNLTQICLKWILITAAVFTIMFSFVAFTHVGNAVAISIKENAEIIVDRVFTPKEVPLNLEGIGEEDTLHMPYTKVINDEALSDYVIYVDEASYYTYEKDGVSVIAQIPIQHTREEAKEDLGALVDGLDEKEIDERLAELEEFYANLPECKIEITQVAGASPQTTAENMLADFQETSTYVSEITDSGLVNGLYMYASTGIEWNSEVTEVHLVDNQKGGVFIITVYYFMDATEGHGERVSAMIRTFEVFSEIVEEG